MKTKAAMLIGTLAIVMVVFFIGIQSYFNNKEIRLASDRCFEVNGMPEVKGDFLNLNY